MQTAKYLVRGALAALCTTVFLHAQCAEAQFGTSLGAGDDVVFPIQPIGFPFPFNGTTYTDVHISTNGLVYLSNAGVPAPGGTGCCSGTTAALVAGGPKIGAAWNDHVADGPGFVYYNNTIPGKAVITWDQVRRYGTTTPRYTFQLVLGIAGDITVAFDSTFAVPSGTCLVGMSEGVPAIAGPAADLSAGGASATNTTYELFDNLALPFDLAGQSVLFFPTSPGPGWSWISIPCPRGSHVSYGDGCYPGYTGYGSFYEFFPTNAIDLANTSMSMLPIGNGYVVMPGVTAYVPPVSPQVIALFDDDESQVSLSSAFVYPGGITNTLTVCSNGFVSVATGNTIDYWPDPLVFLDEPVTAFWSWHDFNPSAAGSGQVKFEEIGGVAYITWDGVYSYGTSNPETMQFQFDLNTGAVHVVWGQIGGAGNQFLVGYSAGGVSVDPGSIDLTAALPGTFTVYGADLSTQLVLKAAPSAVPGGAVNFTVSGIPDYNPPSGLYLAAHILSYSPIPAPGIDLGFLGAAGCPLLVATLDIITPMVGFSETLSLSFPVPPLAPLGASAASQALGLFTPFTMPGGNNAAGITSSNGIISTVGAW